MGMPWGRLAGILVAVSLGTLAAAWVLEGWRGWWPRRQDVAEHGQTWVAAPLATFLLTATSLSLVQLLVPRPMLLPERFAAHAGWWVVVALSTWAGWPGFEPSLHPHPHTSRLLPILVANVRVEEGPASVRRRALPPHRPHVRISRSGFLKRDSPSRPRCV